MNFTDYRTKTSPYANCPAGDKLWKLLESKAFWRNTGKSVAYFCMLDGSCVRELLVAAGVDLCRCGCPKCQPWKNRYFSWWLKPDVATPSSTHQAKEPGASPGGTGERSQEERSPRPAKTNSPPAKRNVRRSGTKCQGPRWRPGQPG